MSALTGSIWTEIEEITKDSTKIFDLLGKAIPGQSTFFMQFLLVKTFVGTGLELLKFMPLFRATVRMFIGPRLSQAERSRRVLGFCRPLAEPLWLLHAEAYGANVLYFMVFFVYSALAPVVNWVLMFCFLVMYPCWRYQIFTNYPMKPDSGGRMWIIFMGVIRASTIIGQLSLWAILSLDSFPYAVPLMLPLLGLNVLFNVYIEQRHKHVAEFLGTDECMAVDEQTMDLDFEFVRDKYKQPSLRARRRVYPENIERMPSSSDCCILPPSLSNEDIEAVTTRSSVQ